MSLFYKPFITFTKGEFMKKSLLLSIMLVMSWVSEAKALNRKVLMMVSEGFYAPEYYVPLKAFQEKGIQVVTATKLSGATQPDHRQIGQYPAVKGDMTFDKIEVGDFDAIVFAGGNGAWEDFFPNEDVHKALTSFMKAGKVVALLCSSTGLLGVANNLDGNGEPVAKGRKVTGYGRVEGLLTRLGKVQYSAGEKGKPHVVVDGKLVTGRDPMSSELFAEKVIEVLEK